MPSLDSQPAMPPTPVDRLSAFIEAWRGATGSHLAAPLEDRLERLLPILRPLLAEAQPNDFGSTGPALADAARLARLLPNLRKALRAAGKQGVLMNVWRVAGLKRDEVRNAGALAALFNPLASGDRAAPFLAGFLELARGDGRDRLPSLSVLRQGYSVQAEACPLGAADNRVDLSIEGADFIVLIEVKIDAGEGLEQLARYERVLRSKAQALGKRAALIYLSPTPARSPPQGIFYADWACVARAARAVVAAQPRSDRSFQDTLLTQFAEHIQSF